MPYDEYGNYYEDWSWDDTSPSVLLDAAYGNNSGYNYDGTVEAPPYDIGAIGVDSQTFDPGLWGSDFTFDWGSFLGDLTGSPEFSGDWGANPVTDMTNAAGVSDASPFWNQDGTFDWVGYVDSINAPPDSFNGDWSGENQNQGDGPTYTNLLDSNTQQMFGELNDYLGSKNVNDLLNSIVSSNGNIDLTNNAILEKLGNEKGSGFWSKLGQILGSDGSTASTLGKLAQLGGSVGQAALQNSAANKATQAQVEAAKYAADLQYKAKQEALALQEKIWNQQQQNQQPWLDAGKGALTTLTGEMDALTAPYGKTFVAPTLTETNDPGYAFRLAEGQKALENSAAARGGALGGAALKDALKYGQNYASSEYDKVYGRAKDQFDTEYNIWANDQANRYNRLAGVANTGQTSANQLNNSGSNYAANASNTIGSAANNMGDYATQAGNARASGYIQNGNNWSNLLGNINDYISLAQILGGN